ncbi:HAD-IIB family hydrolase [Vannielia litorea]|uniref:Mannosyl-3-phosphoglycerate phosphatase n=1 Tax=Vannielia litorea TaxID=1217970 RepID=A0A1N6GF16_9RHOB|nr:HAD-IIB family hydrolase [Vannielia litorea]SIO06113.1 mannosyl-3-phosphoglycerate phosphatase [Vannielia litorea]
MPSDLIIFTDLDGTLLDHHSYSYAAAQSALSRVVKESFPLVLSSSKTAAEMAALARELPASPAALIVENGAGVVWSGEDTATGGRHGALMEALARVTPELRALFEGFADLGPEGVARLTGLPPAEAALASRRDWSEPGIWRGSEEARAAFLAELAAQGVTARQGGRFLTLSFGADKADRMKEVADRIAPTAHVLALGDAPNDIGMLEAADTGIIIANPHGAGIPPLPGEETGRIRRAGEGPAGWNAAVLAFIDELTSANRQA